MPVITGTAVGSARGGGVLIATARGQVVAYPMYASYQYGGEMYRSASGQEYVVGAPFSSSYQGGYSGGPDATRGILPYSPAWYQAQERAQQAERERQRQEEIIQFKKQGTELSSQTDQLEAQRIELERKIKFWNEDLSQKEETSKILQYKQKEYYENLKAQIDEYNQKQQVLSGQSSQFNTQVMAKNFQAQVDQIQAEKIHALQEADLRKKGYTPIASLVGGGELWERQPQITDYLTPEMFKEKPFEEQSKYVSEQHIKTSNVEVLKKEQPKFISAVQKEQKQFFSETYPTQIDVNKQLTWEKQLPYFFERGVVKGYEIGKSIVPEPKNWGGKIIQEDIGFAFGVIGGVESLARGITYKFMKATPYGKLESAQSDIALTSELVGFGTIIALPYEKGLSFVGLQSKIVKPRFFGVQIIKEGERPFFGYVYQEEKIFGRTVGYKVQPYYSEVVPKGFVSESKIGLISVPVEEETVFKGTVFLKTEKLSGLTGFERKTFVAPEFTVRKLETLPFPEYGEDIKAIGWATKGTEKTEEFGVKLVEETIQIKPIEKGVFIDVFAKPSRVFEKNLISSELKGGFPSEIKISESPFPPMKVLERGEIQKISKGKIVQEKEKLLFKTFEREIGEEKTGVIFYKGKNIEGKEVFWKPLEPKESDLLRLEKGRLKPKGMKPLWESQFQKVEKQEKFWEKYYFEKAEIEKEKQLINKVVEQYAGKQTQKQILKEKLVEKIKPTYIIPESVLYFGKEEKTIFSKLPKTIGFSISTEEQVMRFPIGIQEKVRTMEIQQQKIFEKTLQLQMKISKQFENLKTKKLEIPSLKERIGFGESLKIGQKEVIQMGIQTGQQLKMQQLTSLKTKTVEALKTKTIQKLRPVEFPKPPRIPHIPILRIPPFQLPKEEEDVFGKKKKKKKKGFFDVLIKRRGKFLVAGTGLGKAEAMEIGVRETAGFGRTPFAPARTFKLVSREPEINLEKLNIDNRFYVKGERFIEKRRFAMSTPLERYSIRRGL